MNEILYKGISAANLKLHLNFKNKWDNSVVRYIYDKKDLNRKTYDITASWAGPYVCKMAEFSKKKIKNSLPLHKWKKIFFPTPLYIFKKN